jgi:hypothetical protein
MAKNRKATDNYNKDYFTADGIPQPAAEYPTDLEQKEVTENRPGKPKPEPELTGPNHDPEIARAMGRVKTGKAGSRKKR